MNLASGFAFFLTAIRGQTPQVAERLLFLSFYGRLLPSLGKQTKSRKPPVTQDFGLASWNFNLKAWKFDIDMYLNIFYLLRFLNHLEVLDVKIWDEQLKFNCQNSGEKCNS